jgi:hypothetical protein
MSGKQSFSDPLVDVHDGDGCTARGRRSRLVRPQLPCRADAQLPRDLWSVDEQHGHGAASGGCGRLLRGIAEVGLFADAQCLRRSRAQDDDLIPHLELSIGIQLEGGELHAIPRMDDVSSDHDLVSSLNAVRHIVLAVSKVPDVPSERKTERCARLIDSGPTNGQSLEAVIAECGQAKRTQLVDHIGRAPVEASCPRLSTLHVIGCQDGHVRLEPSCVNGQHSGGLRLAFPRIDRTRAKNGQGHGDGHGTAR